MLEKLGDLQQVETLVQGLAKHYPKDPAFHRLLAKLYANQKRMDDVEKELRAIAAIDPAKVEAALDVVRFLGSVRGPEAARQELLAKIKSSENAFPYRVALAEFEFLQGNRAESIRMFDGLISSEKVPENVLVAQARLAGLYYGTKNFDAVEPLVADILRKDTRNYDALKLRAMLRMEQGKLDPAIIDLRQVLNDQPRATEIMLLLAVAYERNGSIDLAEKQYSEATRASNFDANVGLNYVAFLQRRGSATRAEDILAETRARVGPTILRFCRHSQALN